jgi:hypothetical protein
MKKQLFLLYAISFAFVQTNATNRTWVGKGAGGSGTNFNTASNWSPSGVPGSSDNLTLTLTSNATITLSTNTSIRNLTYTVSNNNIIVTLDVSTYTLTVNGVSSIQALSGNNNTTAEIGASGTNAGIIDFVGNVNFGTNVLSSGAGPVLIGNSNSKVIFRGNLTLGRQAATYSTSLVPGLVVFDGTGSQTLTWDCNKWAFYFNSITVGSSNNPTLTQVTGLQAPYDIAGDLTVNGSSVLDLGTSDLNRATSGGTFSLNNTSKLKLGTNSGGQSGSNFPLNFSTLSLNAASTVEYYNTSNQTIYNIPSPGYGSLTLTNNSTKTAGGALDIRGSFTVNSGVTFSAGTSLTHNIGGNWSNGGTFSYTTASTIVLNGSSQQTISGTATFNNLIINNTANNPSGDILLSSTNATITGTCTFTDGIINSSTGNMLIFNDNAISSGANNNSFVNVQVRKIGNDVFTFPVGKLSVGYMLCGISAPSSTTDAFTAEYKRNSATALGSITAPGLYRVSACEYWQLDRTTGSSNVNVTLSWSGLSPCNASAYVTSLADLTVAHFNGTSWNTHAVTSYTGNASSGTITRNGVSVFSPFSIGSTSATTNPLPIKFSAVKAYRIGNNNHIEWTNMTEENLSLYEVERSSNGTSFTKIISVLPKTNNGQENKYTETDENTLEGINYYRIKAIQTDGSYEYSTIVKVIPSSTAERSTSVYPNPVVSGQFTLQMNNYIRGEYSLRLINSNGQQVMMKTIQHSGGSMSISLEKPQTIQPGLYILQVRGENADENMKVMIR